MSIIADSKNKSTVYWRPPASPFCTKAVVAGKMVLEKEIIHV
jgi:hypothetical protein